MAESEEPPPPGPPGPPSRQPQRRRRFAPDDDLLSGFDREGRPQELRAFFATTIAASLVVWDLTFTLGAYHTVFYFRLFQILVVSTVLLVGSIVLRRDIKVRRSTLILLAVPLLWIVLRLIPPLGRTSTSGHVLDHVLIGFIVACVPFTLWAAARIVAPDYFALPTRRLKAAALSIVVLVAVAGLLVGQFNFRFTTCHEYDVSGANTPTNCFR